LRLPRLPRPSAKDSFIVDPCALWVCAIRPLASAGWVGVATWLLPWVGLLLLLWHGPILRCQTSRPWCCMRRWRWWRW